MLRLSEVEERSILRGKKMNINPKTNKLLKMALIVAVYVVVTFALAPVSFTVVGIQFRLSEVLVLLALIDPLYMPALTLGCLISNFLLSPMGIVDVIVGTSATLIALILMICTKKQLEKKQGISSGKVLFISSLWATVINALMVGAELYYVLNLPFWLSVVQVAIGEFVVVSIIGVIIFKKLMLNNSLYNKLKL